MILALYRYALRIGLTICILRVKALMPLLRYKLSVSYCIVKSNSFGRSNMDSVAILYSRGGVKTVLNADTTGSQQSLGVQPFF